MSYLVRNQICRLLRNAASVLEKFDVTFEIRVASAHRAPKYLEEIISAAEDSGCQVFIGMAGVALRPFPE